MSRKLPQLKLIGDVDHEMTLKVANYIDRIGGKTCEPVEIMLSTFGGNVSDALAIYDMVCNLSNPIHIHCIGACMSAGTIILGSGDLRTASPNTQFLVHYGSEISDSEDTVKHNKRVNDITKEILMAYTGKTKRTITNWYKLEKYFLADEALKLGFIHEIQ